MNLCRCKRGHFYDKDKDSSCPYCARGSVFIFMERVKKGIRKWKIWCKPKDMEKTERKIDLCRCEKGHFYLKNKHSSCPYCAGEIASDDKRVQAFTEDFTVPMGGESQPPLARPTVSLGMPIDQPTVHLMTEQNDDHTVGFFPDVFPGVINLCRCKEGHFYDKDEHSCCPICAREMLLMKLLNEQQGMLEQIQKQNKNRKKIEKHRRKKRRKGEKL